MKSVSIMIVGLLLGGAVIAQEKSALTTEQVLKAEVQVLKEKLFNAEYANAALRAQFADLQAKYDGITLTAQNADLKSKRDSLDAEIRKALKATDADEVDWSTSPPSLKKKAAPVK